MTAEPVVVLDCLGKPCPIPVIELARAVRSCAPGDLVELLSDDSAAASDVAAWCRMTGHSLEAASSPSYRVRKVR